MRTEGRIKENLISTTIQPITDVEEIINAICEWNGITLADFKSKVGAFKVLGTDTNGQKIFSNDYGEMIKPIERYLSSAYNGKTVVFEKDNEKYFGKLRIVPAEPTRYMLGEKVIEIPYEIRAENENGTSIILFPKVSDIIQSRMKSMYVVNTGWAERQRLEKEIMAKLIELAQVRGGNEIISTQNMMEELKETLKKRGIDLELGDLTFLRFPRRKIRDTAKRDDEYMAPPISVSIDFESRLIQCQGYSCHGFGTPSSWGNPCWGNWGTEISNCLRDCDLKELINLIISWAYGYNSDDTGRTHDGRHPLGKLREYIWRMYDHRDELAPITLQGIKENFEEIKKDLSIDNWLENTSRASEYLSQFSSNNEASE